MKKWRDILIFVAVIVVVIMGVINVLMQIDELRDLSKPTAFERLAQKVSDFSKKVLEAYREGTGGPARTPSWYAEHCDYIEIDPMDESPDLPDGIYENCDESSIKKSPDTWEHWFPTVPKPDKSSTKSPKKDLSDRYNDKTLDPTRTIPGEPARHWEIIPARKLKGSVIY